MQYSDLLTIYRDSGPIAAALCINDVADFPFEECIVDCPDIAHKAPIDSMTRLGILSLVSKNPDWLQGVDTQKFNIYLKRGLLEGKPDIRHLDVSCFDSFDWVQVLGMNLQIINHHREQIFAHVSILSWHSLTLRYPALRQECDVETVVSIFDDPTVSTDYKFYLSMMRVADYLECGVKPI